jgi:hypothetical protein
MCRPRLAAGCIAAAAGAGVTVASAHPFCILLLQEYEKRLLAKDHDLNTARDHANALAKQVEALQVGVTRGVCGVTRVTVTVWHTGNNTFFGGQHQQ